MRGGNSVRTTSIPTWHKPVVPQCVILATDEDFQSAVGIAADDKIIRQFASELFPIRPLRPCLRSVPIRRVSSLNKSFHPAVGIAPERVTAGQFAPQRIPCRPITVRRH